MSEAIKKVLSNCQQSFSGSEKAQARNNIGALGGVKVQTPTGTSELVPDAEGKVTVDLTQVREQVQSDWAQNDPTAVDFIKNKPTIPTVDQTFGPSSANAQSGVAVAEAIAGIRQLPASTAADADKVLTVDANGDPGWSSLREGEIPYAIASGSIAFTPGSYATDGDITLSDIRSSGIEYAYSNDGWVIEKDHVYVIAFNIVASVGYAEAGRVDGRIWLDGFLETDQVWKFSLDTSAVHDESLVGSAIICPRSRGEVHLNIRYASPSLAHVPSAYVNKAEIVDVTSRVGGGTKSLVAGTNIEIIDHVDSTTINSTATKIVTRSDPYTTDVPITEMRVYDPNENYGALVRDQANTTIGYFAPKHSGNTDAGKVLTVVDDNGYKLEWKASPGGSSDLKLLTEITRNVDGGAGAYQLTVADGYAYTLNMLVDREVKLITNSTETVHTRIAIHNNDGSTCGACILTWRDEALVQHQIYLDLYNKPDTTVYYFDVHIKKVTVNGTSYAIARVSDYPCAYRDGYENGYTTDNINFIGRNY